MSFPGFSTIMRNGGMLPLAEVPRIEGDPFFRLILDAIGDGWRVVSYFGSRNGDDTELICILGSKREGTLAPIATSVTGSFPSLTPLCPQVHLFEREIYEQTGARPEGHPWLKPVRFQEKLGKTASIPSPKRLPGVADYFRVGGEEVHQVAVGPVHAGIIEPGHFRFQCHGEVVFHLEIMLGYQHRGIEQSLIGGPYPITPYRMETIAGDTTVGHMQAYCMVLEALAGIRVPARGEAVRALGLELERLANHTGDLGAIAGDVAYLPTASFCGRIRGDLLNMSADLCGSRFGRGLVRPGGAGFDPTPEIKQRLREKVKTVRRDLTEAVDLLWNTPAVMSRLEGTGKVTADTTEELGLVGPAARAAGLECDIRRDYPFGLFRMLQIPVMTTQGGDVHARTLVRWLECRRSLDFIEEMLGQMPGGGVRNEAKAPKPAALAVAMTEGWRGKICHVAVTDDTGRFARYKITDPSFHNWQGLAMALRNEQISDFPLCNKSFNLSYCGFDL